MRKRLPSFKNSRVFLGISRHRLARLSHAYAVSGKRGEAEEVLLKLEDLSKSRYVAPFDVAAVYIGLGDEDRAMEWLEKAYEARCSWIIRVNVDPRFDALREDPRYQALLRRMGLPL